MMSDYYCYSCGEAGVYHGGIDECLAYARNRAEAAEAEVARLTARVAELEEMGENILISLDINPNAIPGDMVEMTIKMVIDALHTRVAELEDHIQQTTPETERVCVVCGTTEELTRWLEEGRLRHFGLVRRRAAVLVWRCPRHAPTDEGAA